MKENDHLTTATVPWTWWFLHTCSPQCDSGDFTCPSCAGSPPLPPIMRGIGNLPNIKLESACLMLINPDWPGRGGYGVAFNMKRTAG